MAMVAAGGGIVRFAWRIFRLSCCFVGLLAGSGCVQEDVVVVLADQDVAEGYELHVVEIPVKLSAPAPRPVTLRYSTRALSADPGRDFEPLEGELQFQPGQSQQILRVSIHGNRTFDPDRAFAIMIEPQSDEHVRVYNPKGDGNLLLVNIRDDDPVPIAEFAIPVASVDEATSKLSIPIRLSSPSDHDVPLIIAASGTAVAGEDFLLPAGGRIVVPAGASEINLDLTFLYDNKDECPEWLDLKLLPQTGVKVGAQATFRVRIEDDAANRRKLSVGPTATYLTPSAAAAAAHAGDMVEIAAGTYRGDVAVWKQNNLLICGDETGVILDADGKSAAGKGIWVISGNNVTVEHVTFQNARVADKNGAGIRFEGDELTVRYSRFIRNENGILTGNNSAAVLRVENSTFIENGAGDGYSHNLYVGKIRLLEMRYNEMRGAVVGHNVKSRAKESILQNNWILDGDDGRASYQVDLPNGGLALLLGNVIQQGVHAENSTMVSYGAEGFAHDVNTLLMVNNTVVNDRSAGIFVRAREGSQVRLLNNLFAGKARLETPRAEQYGNVVTEAPGFVDRRNRDYRLSAKSPAIDAGVEPGKFQGKELRPKYEFIPGAGKRPRPSKGALDAGAFEFIAAP